MKDFKSFFINLVSLQMNKQHLLKLTKSGKDKK